MHTVLKTAAAAACLAAATAVFGAVDLGTYKGCAATDADFEHLEIVPQGTADGPLKLAFDARDNNLVDVYFIEKNCRLKKYDAATKTVTLLGTLPCATGSEDGLVGLALDPNFKTDKTLFLNYSFLSSDKSESTYRISRFKLGGDGKLDLATEKVLLKIPSNRNHPHTAGAMMFDAYGDLWMAIGDNEQIEDGPANTADLRGGILRIHPDESARGYAIPKGNFGEALSARLKAAGNADLAAQYGDTNKVRREIYVKGTRNAYSLTVDPVRRWLTWGDVGPDQQKVADENNLVKDPYYMGWPYFAGEEDMGGISPYGSQVPTGNQRSGPVVKSDIQGVKQLPAIREPIFKRQEGCAMTGPIFRYDGSNPSPFQFPPQFDRKWMISGCDSYGFHLLTLDAAGESTTGDVKVFGNMSSNTLVDLKQGPDGALYYVNYGRGIDEIRYKGACKDPGLLPEKPVTTMAYRPMDADWGWLDSRRISITVPGAHEVRIMDIRGRTVMAFRGEGKKQYALTGITEPGLYQVRVKTEQGVVTRKLLR